MDGDLAVRASGEQLHAEVGGDGGGERDLVGRERIGEDEAGLIMNDLLHGEPAEALDEAALDLAAIDLGIERGAAILENVDAVEPHLAGQGVDGHLGAGGAIDEIEEGPALSALAVPAD